MSDTGANKDFDGSVNGTFADSGRQSASKVGWPDWSKPIDFPIYLIALTSLTEAI